MLRTRTVREGSVGLLILLGLGLFGLLVLWLRGVSFGQQSYKFTVQFANASGIQEGAEVRYRGVGVGRIERIRPQPNGVDVEIAISQPDLLIPSDVTVQANQSGLIGETFIDIVPRDRLPVSKIETKPLERDCDPNVIVCNNARLQGEMGVSFEELLRVTIQFAEQFSDPKFFNSLQTAADNTSKAAAGINRLSTEVTGLTKTVRQELSEVSGSAQSTANSVSQAAQEIKLTANQLNGLLSSNRSTLVSTLDNLNQASGQLRTAVGGLTPVLNRVQQGEIIRNLEVLSANAVQASNNLRDVSQALNSPTNLLVLQQTLDSARATFQNTQKITSDLDELTGDPTFRQNVRNLVNGLSGLVSSTQQLQQQTQLAQVLTPMAIAVNRATPVPAVATLPVAPVVSPPTHATVPVFSAKAEKPQEAPQSMIPALLGTPPAAPAAQPSPVSAEP